MEIIGSFVLAIAHSILFYGKEIGISMLLFSIIGNGIVYNILKKRDRIKNKRGFLLIIPILLLSSIYVIFSDRTFYITNIFIITILNILMLIIVTNKKDSLKNHLRHTFELGVATISNYKDGIKIIKEKASQCRKNKNAIGKENLKKVIISVLLVSAIVGVVILLLASADNMFAKLCLVAIRILERINIKGVSHIIFRIGITIVVTILILSFILKLQKECVDKKEEQKATSGKYDFTIKLLLIALNIVYLVFCYIQVKPFFTTRSLDSLFNYARYARTGFFQLMFVSLINYTIILISNKCSNPKEKSIKILKIFLVIFTIIIAISSMHRMYMYEMEYGLTYSRFFVYIILLTELATFVPTTISIFDEKIDFVKWNMIIILCVYCVINFVNIEKVIINKNINKTSHKRAIDYTYIANIASEDSYSVLEEKMNKESTSTSDKLEIAEILLEIVGNSEKMDWQEFNISKCKLREKHIDQQKLKDDIVEWSKQRQEEKSLENASKNFENYIYHEKINENEEYFVEQVGKAMGTALWRISKVTNNGKTYTEINRIEVSTPSKIKFFANGLGFLERPNSIYCAKADLLITRDSGKTFQKIDFPSGVFTISDPQGEKWENCYDYFYLPTKEKDGTLTVLVSGGYEGGYNRGKTRAKYISRDNGKTWRFVGEVEKENINS